EAESQGLASLVVVNKIDLASGPEGREALEEGARTYRTLGVQVVLASALTGDGVADVEAALRGKITALSGHSGVGKTSILNRLVPDLDLPTREVNPVTGKGRQTTTAASLISLKAGGYVVDTPGFREFSLAGLEPTEVGGLYPDFREA